MSQTELRRAQLEWARRRKLLVDQRGYVRERKRNFFTTLGAATLRDYRRGSGGELTGRGEAPAKLLALHSSAALVCNAFEYWRTGELEVIERALGLPASIMEMRFEAQFPTGLKGEPPNLDVALELENGSTWAIESKFTEPFGGAKDPRKSLRAAYFPGDTTIWTQRGLRRCGEIAKKLRDGELRWRRLDAPQLLKHILGLHTCRRTFTLVYLWMDTNSAAGEEHRKELAAFTEELSGEVPFVSVSYQQFVGRLRALTGPRHGKYFEYMQDRYVGRPEGSSKAANRERN